MSELIYSYTLDLEYIFVLRKNNNKVERRDEQNTAKITCRPWLSYCLKEIRILVHFNGFLTKMIHEIDITSHFGI